FPPAATVAIAIAPSATSLTPPVATPAATAAIAEPFAAATPSASVPTPAVGPFGTASAMFLRDRSSAEFSRWNEETKICIVRGDLPSLRPFVSRTVQVASSEFERSATDGTESLDHSEVRLGRRQLHRGLHLDDFRPDDVAEAEFVVDVLRVVLRDGDLIAGEDHLRFHSDRSAPRSARTGDLGI